MSSKLAASVFFLAVTIGTSVGATTTLRVHKLVVAANPSMGMTNDRVDKIISGMNDVLNKKWFSWDVACTGVRIVRSGSVIHNDQLLTDGSVDDLRQNMHAYAPGANVLIVSTMVCTQQTQNLRVAGCGVIGEDDLVVGKFPGYDPILWAHERGHNVGLEHSAEATSGYDDQVAESIGKRIMFWILGHDHKGKTQDECDAYMNANLPSISSVARAAAIAPDEDHLVAVSQQSVSTQSSTEQRYQLTQDAFKIIDPPWVEGVPIAKIKSLNEKDVESIRIMLNANPNRLWPQAISALSLVGNEADEKLIAKALHLPAPAIAPDTKLSDEELDQISDIQRIKLTAPSALGVLAKRTRSEQAVKTLLSIADVNAASKVIGPGDASALSKAAISALATTGRPESTTFVKQVIDTQNSAVITPGATTPEKTSIRITKDGVQIPAFAPREIMRLDSILKSQTDK